MTTFQVVTANVRADEADDPRPNDVIDERDAVKRLTLADGEAVLPSVVASPLGTHIAWVDVADSGDMTLRWKFSSDGGNTFSPDTTLSPSFVSITDVQIASSDDGNSIAIALVGTTISSPEPSVYVLGSSDAGGNWTQMSYIAGGSECAIVMRDNCVFLGLFTVNETEPIFSIISLDIDGSKIEYDRTLISLQLPVSMVRMVADDDRLHYVLVVGPYHMQMVYGSVSYDGAILSEPCPVWSTIGYYISDFDLLTNDGVLNAIFAVNGGPLSTLCLASLPSGSWHWAFSEVAAVAATLGNVSVVQSHGTIYIAFESNCDGTNSIMGLKMSSAGRVIDDSFVISTNAFAERPSLIASTLGTIDCTWTQSYDPGREVVLKTDVDFQKPNLLKLVRLIEALEPTAFVNGEEARIRALDYLTGIADAYANQDGVTAKTLVAALGACLRGQGSEYLAFNTLSADYEELDRILESLTYLEDKSVYYLNDYMPSYGLNDRAVDPDFYDVTVDIDPIALSATITWKTVFDSDEVAVKYGVASTAENRCAGLASGSINAVTIYNLAPNTSYRCQLVSGDRSSSIYRFDSFVSVSSVSVQSVFTTATLSWQTNVPCVCSFEYATISVSDKTAATVVSTPDGMSHSVALSGLTASTNYSYAIDAAYVGEDLDAASEGVFNTTDLEISNIVVDTSSGAAKISWYTNHPAFCSIDIDGDGSDAIAVSSSEDFTHHWVVVNALGSNTTYDIDIVADYTMSPSYRTVHREDIRFGLISNGSADVTVGNVTYVAQPVQLGTNPSDTDAGQSGDAGDTFAAARQIVPSKFNGRLTRTADAYDYYKIYLLQGQKLKLSLTVPTGHDHDIAILNPSGTVVASGASRSTGGWEYAEYVVTSGGFWGIRVYSYSGTGGGIYSLLVNISSGSLDRTSLQVGVSGDSDILGRAQGFSIESGWSGSGSYRTGVAGSTFLYNLYYDTYLSYTDYLVTFTYYSANSVTVSCYNGAGWVDVGVLPGKTTTAAASIVIRSSDLYDALPSTLGMQVRLKFSVTLNLYWIDGVAYSFNSQFTSANHYVGILPDSGWTRSGAIMNATTGATIFVNVPRADIQYLVEFIYQDVLDGMQVQQRTSSTAWTSIGVLRRNGRSAVVLLNSDVYYDALPGSIGLNVQIKLMSPLHNLTALKMSPGKVLTDVGVGGDTDVVSHFLGMCVWDDGKWGGATTVDGRTVRQATSSYAILPLSAPWSEKGYEIKIAYKSSQAGNFIIWKGTADVVCASILGDNAWHEAAFRISPADYYDAFSNCEMNLLIKATVSGIYIDYLMVSVDTDSDTLSDSYEAVRFAGVYAFDPFAADTDSDNLNDNVEISSSWNTNPTDPDSDDDGLLDGNEVWSQTWSSEKYYKVPNGAGNNGRPCIPIIIPACPLNRVTSVKVHIGVTTDRAQDIEIWLNKVGLSPHLCLYYRAHSGANVFETIVPTDGTYTMAQYAAGGTFNFYVADWNTAGGDGQVQYVRLELSGKTNALDADTDDDGISDGEEVNFGADGWATNPVLQDTDSDGVNDPVEISGSGTLCGYKLDPTCKDTDGDGFNDNIDRVLGDGYMEIDINRVYDRTGHTTVGTFFVFHVFSTTTIDIATQRIPLSTLTPYLKYYVDIPDNLASVNLDMQIWEDSPNTNPAGDDLLLRLDGGSTCVSTSFAWTTSYLTKYGTDVDSRVVLLKYAREKTNTIVINGTDYGLDKVSTNEYRYNADEQLYVLYVNCSSSSTHFVSGLNTVLLPRAIALESKLNYTFADLLNRLSGTPLAGAKVYDRSSASSGSGSVLMIISTVLMTGAQAETLLGYLTHDATNKRIANNVTISSSSVYRLHLPAEVLDCVASSAVTNSGLGGAPQYLDINVLRNLFNAITNFVYGLVVTVANFLAALAQTLVNLGLDILATLSSITAAIDQAVRNAIKAVADAFNAFVQWAIEFITNTAQALLTTVLNAIKGILNAAFYGLSLIADLSYQEVENTGQMSVETQDRLMQAIFPPTFVAAIMALAIALSVVFIAIDVVSLGATLLVTGLILCVATVIITGLFGNIQTTSYNGETPTVITASIILGLLGLSGESSGQSLRSIATMETTAQSTGLNYNWLDAVCTMLSFSTGVIALFIGMGISSWIGFGGLIIGFIGAFSGLKAFLDNNDRLAWISVDLGFYSFLAGLVDWVKAGSDRYVLLLMIIFASVSVGTGVIPLLT